MSDTNHLSLELENGVARIRFNRPDVLNAIDVTMAQQLLAAITELRAGGDVRVIVLSGQGRAFMAGGDLQMFFADLPNAAGTAREIIDPLHAAIELMAEGDAPVIASLHGAVAGAGMSLAMGADLAIAADNTKFNMAYARIGASVDGGGTWALARLVGLRRAMEIALLSDVIDAQTALQLGLVNRVVLAADLEQETTALATRLAQGPTLAYGRIRRLLRESHRNDLATQLRSERDAFAVGAGTKDFAEGLTAFFGKRPPIFTGK
jgi:2-(1,2-epoxy-1,2-dihydrophenyl)acetyl-CoA isomerase